MKMSFPSQRTKCQEIRNQFISEYFNPTGAFTGNTGCLSTTCHPSLCHGSDSVGTALLQIIKGRNARAACQWADGTSELRHAINHSYVGAKQFILLEFYFSVWKTVLSSWCSPNPRLRLDWLFSHRLCPG